MTIRNFDASSAAIVYSVSGMPGREILPVAKDRTQCLRHRPDQRLAPGEVPVDAIAFECCVQPLAPRLIAVAVAQEGTISERDRLAHPRLCEIIAAYLRAESAKNRAIQAMNKV
jgi:hypothetical protein